MIGDQIREIYAPGAKVTICSDGRVFSDLVAVTDENVTLYGVLQRFVKNSAISHESLAPSGFPDWVAYFTPKSLKKRQPRVQANCNLPLVVVDSNSNCSDRND